MQNDLFWYNEKDDGDFMTPSFEGPDYFGCPSEDKFIMTSDLDKQWENPGLGLNYNSKDIVSEISIDYLDKTCHFSIGPVHNESDVPRTDYEAGLEGDHPGSCVHYDCSIPFCDCSAEANGFYGENHGKDSNLSMKQSVLGDVDVKVVGDSTESDTESARHMGIDESTYCAAKKGSVHFWDEWLNGSTGLCVKVPEKDFMVNKISKYKVENCVTNKETDELKAAENFEGIANDEILAYTTHEDEYEVFDLRIIHRKNRFC